MRSVPWYRIVGAQTRTDPLPQGIQPIASPAATPPPTDAELIDSLRRQLSNRDQLITQLREKHDEASPVEPRLLGGSNCPGCEQLHKVIAEYEAEHARDRAIIARLELATDKGRARTLGRPMAPLPDGGA